MPRDLRLRLADMIEACDRIARYVAGVEEADFKRNELRIDGVVRNLEIIGEAAKALPDEIRQLAPELDWRNIARMRDRIAHQYFTVDPQIVWKAATEFAPPLREAIARVISRLSD